MTKENAKKEQEPEKEASISDSFIVVTRHGDKSKDIKIKDLTIQLPDGKQTVLLKNFSTTIKQGERIILTGKSGSGKTTTVKGLLGKWDVGSGHISIPESFKVRAIPQHVNLSNTRLSGILNASPESDYQFSDKELRNVLSKVGLDHLIQHLPGQQAELLMDELIDGFLDSFIGRRADNKTLNEIKESLTLKARELTKEQFDYAQYVPDEQRKYFKGVLENSFNALFGKDSVDKKTVCEISKAVCDEIDLTLADIVANVMGGPIQQSAYYSFRPKVFWPRFPVTKAKANYFSWHLNSALKSKFKNYIKNKDTEDPYRDIALNKEQSKYLAKKFSEGVSHEVVEKYTAKNSISGALSFVFNLLSWPVDLIRMPFRARKVAKELTHVMGSFMEKQIVKGDALSRQLSGGQLKKLMAARAMLHKPDLLIMDEITTGIDDKSKRALYQEILDSLPNTTTVISILHDLELTDMHTMHANLEDKTLTLTKVGPKAP